MAKFNYTVRRTQLIRIIAESAIDAERAVKYNALGADDTDKITTLGYSYECERGEEVIEPPLTEEPING